MPSVQMLIDYVAAIHELNQLGWGEDHIADTYRTLSADDPPTYDLYVRATQYGYHKEMVSTVRRAVRQPIGVGYGLIEEGWRWSPDPDDCQTDVAVLSLLLAGSEDRLPKTIGETIQQFPGAMFLRGVFAATIPLQARLWQAYLRLGMASRPKPITRALVAGDLLNAEFASTNLDEELQRSGDVIRFTVDLDDDAWPTWARVRSSQIFRRPLT